ncbi:hypothetical protein HBB16_05480 [Pseudonocardia sp. MCCB 268]|nr:hypothetical protein [Pseudonocardia cytotoxica]
MLLARELADPLSRAVEERLAGALNRVGTILNGLATTKYEELFLPRGNVSARLQVTPGARSSTRGRRASVTSLDMGGLLADPHAAGRRAGAALAGRRLHARLPQGGRPAGRAGTRRAPTSWPRTPSSPP